jgi:nitrate/TMAO reductase-like tetraheme cytochrome c subunit
MMFLNETVTAFSLITVALIVLLLARPNLTEARGGKILAFIAFFILPVFITVIGTSAHVENSKSTSFCLSCHVMEPYGESLRVDSRDHLPALHFQNKLVPRDQACYTCHTTYTMFGDVNAKLQGMKHVYVYYLGTPSEPIELYSDYNNRECLHCHQGARSFEDNEDHMDLREDLGSNEISCLDCHDLAHGIEKLEGLDMWDEVAE